MTFSWKRRPRLTDDVQFETIDRVFGNFAARRSGFPEDSRESREIEKLARFASAAVSRGEVCLRLDEMPLSPDVPGVGYYEKLAAMPEAARVLTPDGKSLLNLRNGKVYLHSFFRCAQIAAEKLAKLDWSIISGGPGTGKTTLVKNLLAAELEKDPALKIRCAAPSGKAKERLGRSLTGLRLADGSPIRGETIHMMLGYAPGSAGGFRHNAENPLDVDVAAIDEMSMVSLELFSHLVDALPDGCRLYLLGDFFQLSAVEPGAVFAELCTLYPEKVTELAQNHRFPADSPLGIAAGAIRRGESDAALEHILSAGTDDFRFRPLPGREALAGALREKVFSPMIELPDGKLHAPSELAAIFRGGVDEEKLAAAFQLAEGFRILAPASTGFYGTGNLNRLVMASLGLADPHAPGTPVMATKNDYRNGIFNGDLGISIGGGKVAFRRNETERGQEKGADAFRIFRFSELEGLAGAFALTVHKSQGSGFQNVLFLTGDATSPLLSRELLYTGLTRTEKRIEIWGSREAVEISLSKSGRRSGGELADFLPPAGQ